MLYSDMSDSSIEFKGETKNVTIVTAITDQERSVRFVLQGLFSRRSTDRAPVPITLKE